MAPRTAAPPRRGSAAPAPRRGTARGPQRQQKNLLNYPRANRRSPWRWWPSLRLVFLLAFFAVLAVVVAVVLAYRATEIPALNPDIEARTTSVFFADGTTKMADFATINRQPVASDQIAQPVKDAIIASEDRTFYENRGVSVSGIGRAVYGVVTDQDLGGGSTITQQYVKNAYLDDSQTYSRKAREALIALKLDQRVDKDQILTDYLNGIYFGRNAYGIETAARAYFGKGAAELSVPEAALLVGVVPAPSAWDPRNDPEKAQERYAYVINSMVETGAITAEEAAGSPTMPETVEPGASQTFAGPNGYILDSVRSELEANGITQEQIDTGGLRVVTTIDPARQQAAVDAMNDPEVYPPQGRPDTVRSGLISIDPATGGVVAMYAGPDYLARSRNVLTQDAAQAGSTFKPFTLVAALEDDWTLRDTLNGRNKRTFKGYDTPVSNFGDSNYGQISLLTATANSVNTAYVELNEDVGWEATKDVAVRAGLPPDDVEEVISNVLGTSTVHPWDLGEAYATFAAQGVHHDAHLVSSVTRIADEQPIFSTDTTGEQVFDPGVIADATVAMQAVVTQGSAERYASRLGRPAAGKTGTSQLNKAAWFAGFTPQLATTVVLFNDGVNAEGKPEQLSLPAFGGARQITGGTWPTAIWERYMEQALDGTEEIDFPPGTARAKPPARTKAPAPSASAAPSESAPAPTETAPPPSEAPAPTPQEPAPGDGDGDGGDGGGGGGGGGDGGGGNGGNGGGGGGGGNGGGGNGGGGGDG